VLACLLSPVPAVPHEPDPKDDTTWSSGGPASNPYTVFSGGDGPGVCSRQGVPNFWVSTYTRELVVQDTDYRYVGQGPDISLTRTWNMPRNAGIAVFGMFGDRWTFSYEIAVDHAGQSESPIFRYVRLKHGSGQRLTYYVDLSSAPPPLQAALPTGVFDTLTWYGGYWLLREKATGWIYRFDTVDGKSYSRLTSIADCYGNTVVLAYSPDATLASVTDAAGRVTGFAYNAGKRCTAMTLPDGRQATYQYDAGGHLVASTDLLGTQTTYAYNAQHFMTSMTVAGRTTQLAIDGEGKVQSVTDARGFVTTYQKHPSGGTLVTDPRGNATFYASSQQGLTTMRTELTPGTFVSTAYLNGRPTEHRDERGSITRYQHDGRGNLTRITDPLGNVSVLEYDGSDRLARLTNAVGGSWTFSYSGCRYPVELTSPSGARTTMAYDAKGQLTGATDPRGKTTTYTYDAFGNLKTIVDPLAKTTTFTYDQYGLRRTSVTDANTFTTSFAHDANDRLTQVMHPDGAVRVFSYDCCGFTGVTDELGNTLAIARDPLLNVTAVTDPLGHTRQYAYDASSNLVSVTDPLGHTGTRTYSATNLPASATDPLGGVVEYGRDAHGNLTSLHDERGRTSTYAYDARNVRTSATDALGKQTMLARDALGRVTAFTNARGGVVTYHYDADGRLVEKRHGGVAVAGHTYDAAGNLLAVVDATGTTTFAYDDAGRVVSQQHPQGGTLEYSWDAAGNLRTMRYPGGPPLAYTYDSRNRLERVDWIGGGSIVFGRDAANRVISETRANGAMTTHEYDAAGRLTRTVHSGAAGAFSDVTYIRDDAGRTVGEVRVPEDLPAGAGSALAAAYDDASRIATLDGVACTVDDDGNVTGVPSAGFAATYDAENRLTSVTRGGVTTTYTYNGLGHRVRAVTGGVTRNAYHDPWGRLMLETDGAGALINLYVWAGGRLAAAGTPSAGYRYYHFDATGSTVAITDPAGNLAATYRYLPHGGIAGRTGTLDNPLTFVGAFGVVDGGHGLYLTAHRAYDARTGRFLQKDPIGLALGTNPYIYAGNDPVGMIDADGLEPDPVASAAVDVTLAGAPPEPIPLARRSGHPSDVVAPIVNLTHGLAAGAWPKVVQDVFSILTDAAGVRRELVDELVEAEYARTGNPTAAIAKTGYILEQLISLKHFKEQLDARAKCQGPESGEAIDPSKGFAAFE